MHASHDCRRIAHGYLVFGFFRLRTLRLRSAGVLVFGSFFGVFLRNELQRGVVHAEPFAGRTRTVGKDEPQVAFAATAFDFDADLALPAALRWGTSFPRVRGLRANGKD